MLSASPQGRRISYWRMMQPSSRGSVLRCLKLACVLSAKCHVNSPLVPATSPFCRYNGLAAFAMTRRALPEFMYTLPGQ